MSHDDSANNSQPMNTNTTIENQGAAVSVGSGTLLGLADFSSMSRDLFWSRFIGGKPCRWSGYDDGHWWKNVATSEQFQVREHEGKRYRLNPETNEVFLCPTLEVSRSPTKYYETRN